MQEKPLEVNVAYATLREVEVIRMFRKIIKILCIIQLLTGFSVYAEPSRPLSTDRPDKTESAYSVDKGYFQIEMDLFSYSDAAAPGEKQLVLSSINFKYGLTERSDLQLLFDGYIEQTSIDSKGSQSDQYGTGDLSLRYKYNLWGNDEGDDALALMPYVKMPTASSEIGNGSYEGGLIMPYALGLTETLGLGLMTELDLVRDNDNAGNHLAFVNSITVSNDFNEFFGMYLEYFTEQQMEENKSFVATFDVGFTVALSTYSQLDFGLNTGVTSAADDLNPFVGFSHKFSGQ